MQRTRAIEYDGFEYGALPVEVVVIVITQCSSAIRIRIAADNSTDL